MTEPRKVRRLIWDIETSPNVVLSWRIGYKIQIAHDNVLKERAIICIGYKWAGEKETYALTWDKFQDDKAMLAKFIKVAGTADELVAHNGDKFDLPWLKTRCIFHGLPTFPNYKTIDTLQWARRKFYFNSNKLNYIATYLGLGGKIKTEFGLWREVLNNNKQALSDMVTYCKRDVELLEQVYDRLSEHCPHKTHVGVLGGLGKWSCPHCGSKKVRKNFTRVTAAGTTSHQMHCRSCGKYHSINDATFNKYLEAKAA